MSDELAKAVNRLAVAIEQHNRLLAAQQATEPEPKEECPRCLGRGLWAPGVSCETCEGRGHL